MRNPLRTIALAMLVAGTFSAPVDATDVASDPMRPDTLRQVSARTTAVYRVNAIIVSDERRIAIVNGRRVGVGDAVGTAQVVSITRSEVILDVDGSRQSLSVSQGAGQ